MVKEHADHFFSLIVPVFKQEATIVDNIRLLQNVLKDIRYPYEIIVVIDGIIDQSLQKLKRAHIPHVKSIAYKINQGKGWALRIGMKAASGDYVMFIDSGEEIDPNGISMLLEHMEWYSADIIVGSKRHAVSRVNYPLSRKILSYGYYYFVKFLFGLGIKDTQAGIKVFRKPVLQKVLPRLVEKKFAGDLEMLVVAKALGYNRIFEAPIKLDYTIAGVTSAATIRSIIGIVVDTLAIFYRKNILHYYDQR